MRVRSAIGGGLVPAALRGSSTEAFLHQFDWFPTLCEAAGIDCNKNFRGNPKYSLSGTSMWPVLKANDITKMASRTLWVSSMCGGGNPDTCQDTERENKNAENYYDNEDVFIKAEPPTTPSGRPALWKYVRTSDKYKRYGDSNARWKPTYEAYRPGGKTAAVDCNANPCLYEVMSDPMEETPYQVITTWAITM